MNECMRRGLAGLSSALGRGWIAPPGFAFLASWLIALLPSVAPAQDGPPATVELRFGGTTVVMDWTLILAIGGRGKRDLLPAEAFDIDPDGPVAIELPPEVLASFSPPCDAIRQALLLHRITPAIADNPLLRGYRAASSEFRGISRLEAPSGRSVLDLYQFDADDLRDYRGEPATFYQSTVTIDLGMQLTRDLRLRLATSAKPCFFERGETFARQLRRFVASRIKN
jgi:hypothetical protein